MRIILFFLILVFTAPCYAEHKVIIQRGSIKNPSQVSEDLVEAYPSLKGTWNPNGLGPGQGCFENPLLRLEFTDSEIRLTVPDSISESRVKKVVKDYMPRPDPEVTRELRRESIRTKLKTGIALTDQEARELVP